MLNVMTGETKLQACVCGTKPWGSSIPRCILHPLTVLHSLESEWSFVVVFSIPDHREQVLGTILFEKIMCWRFFAA